MIITNDFRRVEGLVLEDFQAPLGDYLGARSEETFIRNPVPSAGRLGEIEQASGRAQQVRETDDFPLPEEPFPQPRELSPMLSAEEANERGKAVGLSFSKPTRSEVVDILIQRKREEINRQAIMRRAPGGVGVGAVGLTLDLLVSAADPINVASAFVPVVREARFLAAAGRVGVTGARASRGAVEGAVGAALVEPIVLAASLQEQADYDLMDSLLNVAFGTVLGGGLHTAGGAIGDVLARRAGQPTLSERLSAAPHEVREAAMRTAIAQTLQGRRVDVEPVLAQSGLLDSTSLSTRTLEFRPDEAPIAGRGVQFRPLSQDAPATMVPVIRRDGDVLAFEAREDAARAARREGGDVRVTQREEGDFVLRRRSTLEPNRGPTGAPREFKTRRQAEKFAARTDAVGVEKPAVIPIGEAGQRRYAVVRGATKREISAAEARPDLVSFPEVSRDRVTRTVPLAVEQRPASDFESRLAQVAEGARNPRTVDLADFRASERAEEIIKEIPGEETADTAQQFMEDAVEQVEELRQALDLDDDTIQALFAGLDEQIAEAQALGRAARAAALCEVRA